MAAFAPIVTSACARVFCIMAANGEATPSADTTAKNAEEAPSEPAAVPSDEGEEEAKEQPKEGGESEVSGSLQPADAVEKASNLEKGGNAQSQMQAEADPTTAKPTGDAVSTEVGSTKLAAGEVEQSKNSDKPSEDQPPVAAAVAIDAVA
eukprot:1435993-Rhodomonas_salina.1